MKKMYQTGVDMIRSTILTIIFTFIFIFDLSARESISIVGSSTVYPFSTTVAEEFGRKNASFKSPIVESTGSGGGLKLFCSGLGPNTPDITNASRRIKSKEISLCKSNGVKDIIEIKIGFDGIVFANSKNGIDLELTTKDIYLALAKEVPCGAQDDVTCENQSKLWSDVNSELPELPIMVYGPPPTSGTRDAFVEIAMTDGCNSISWIKDLKKKNKNDNFVVGYIGTFLKEKGIENFYNLAKIFSKKKYKKFKIKFYAIGRIPKKNIKYYLLAYSIFYIKKSIFYPKGKA